MKVHFIAIGGAVMHNLAIALHKKGYIVSGSDDEIFEPSASRLAAYGLLPANTGWDAGKITGDIDTVILGMHARDDNPELIKARKLGISIKSFPEFLYEQSSSKKRVVIGGSHGKTTITSMIMHVLKSCNIKFDYMVGADIRGFETMVGFDDKSEIAVFEGDEYLSSALDRRPKFHLYMPDIAVISGIAWDHINVFPTFDNYLEQFRIFIDKITPGGSLFYYGGDPALNEITKVARRDIRKTAYSAHPYISDINGFSLRVGDKKLPLSIFGDHNMQNISAAMEVCTMLGVSDTDFYSSIAEFRGSAKRLQLIKENKDRALYIDFAHAPSKVRATVSALAQRYKDYKKVCCVELHTFSSLNMAFLSQYKDSLKEADIAFVYYNPHTLELKKLDSISEEDIRISFGDGVSGVFNDSGEMISEIKKIKEKRVVYLFMSSGNFDGINFRDLADILL